MAVPQKILLHNPLSPGDVVVASALPRDIHRCFPGQFQLGYTGVVPEVFENSPYIIPMKEDEPGVFKYRTHYSLVHKSNQNRYHFMHGYHHDFNKQLKEWGINEPVKLTEFKPDIHFSEKELKEPPVTGKYWVISAGGKFDYTAKWWDPRKWQRLVDMLKGEVQFVQVGGASHFHPKLSNTINLIGKTTFRELMCLILHAQGVTCVVTCLMHLAAAANRPCVVVAGGREPWWWEAYTRLNRDANMRLIHGDTWQPPVPDLMMEHVFLHTVGKHGLDCCSKHGCWRSKVEGGKAGSRCKYPCKGPSIVQPKCLMYIEPEKVAKAIRLYTETDLSKLHTILDEDTTKEKEFIPVEIKKTEMDNEVIKPPVTVCILCYGPYVDLHKRCINSVIENTEADKFKLRLGLNEVCAESRTWVNGSLKSSLGDRLTVFDSQENIMKYPMMRNMLYDEKNPVDTTWMVWLDDDSYIVENDWLEKLSQAIRNSNGVHCMFGKKYFWHLRGQQEQWVRQAPWYTGKPVKVDKKHGNRLKVDFVTGGWWAIPVEWMRKMDWPDARIYHNGGDVMMGEAVHQQNGEIKNYEYGVAISKAKRRGFREQAAGTILKG